MYFHGAPRRQIAREYGDAEKQQRRQKKSYNVERTDVVEHARHQAREQERRYHAYNNSRSRERKSLAHDEAQNVSVFRAEREAYAKFLPALRHRI
jgi:hypothetical protein